MDNKLQELTKKIYNEGLEKGKKEAEEIVAKAKKEAGNIIGKAKKESENIISEANKKAEELKKNTQSEMTLSSRQAINALKQKMVNIVISDSVNDALSKSFSDSDFIKKLITRMIENWDKISGSEEGILVYLSENEQKDLSDYLLQTVAKKVKQGFEINFDETIKSGFKIGPKDGSYKISFTDEDFSRFFKQYLRPRTIKLLYGDK